MTLAVVLLVMMAGGIFWYWHSLPKQIPAKKSTPANGADALKSAPVKKSAPAHTPATNSTKHSTTRSATHSNAHKADNKYHAVSIQCRDCACEAAKALTHKRFLTAAAPVLPVAGCDNAHCQCSYAHHADQRADDDDRRSVHSLRTELYTRTAGEERRGSKGRRRDDVG